MQTIIITGIYGMDGFELAKLHIKAGDLVIGIYRRTSTDTGWRLKDLPQTDRFILEPGDVTDYSSIARLVKKYKPDRFYNLAAMSQVWWSFKVPLETLNSTGVGAVNCLEAVRQEVPTCRFYQASSSEMFGDTIKSDSRISILNEDTPFIPRSPYGCAKLLAHSMMRNYREAYNMFAVGGILFNHSSAYRGEQFATRKITSNLARILAGEITHFTMGNLDGARDEGHSEDYMTAAYLMLSQDEPSDYVVATGESHTVREFLELASLCIDLDWSKKVQTDPNLYRPSEINVLLGDASKAKNRLGWKPKYSYFDLVYEMMAKDCERYGVEGCLLSKEEVRNKWNLLYS